MCVCGVCVYVWCVWCVGMQACVCVCVCVLSCLQSPAFHKWFSPLFVLLRKDDSGDHKEKGDGS